MAKVATDPNALVAAGAAASTMRRAMRERDEAMVAAWRAGWGFAEIGRVTGVAAPKVSSIVRRLVDLGEA